MNAELWSDNREMSLMESMGNLVRSELRQEQVVRLDMSYLGVEVDSWWVGRSPADRSKLAIGDLQKLILEKIQLEHLTAIKNLGRRSKYICAVLMEYVFSIPDKELALLVHETMARIAGIVDIKYPYEEHKELFPKDSQEAASDWGKGYGVIRPHSDDLYELRDINVMSLTVCKDTSKTPTWFWRLEDVVAPLSDEELGKLCAMKATFCSGTNVEGHCIQKTKPVLRNDENEGLGLRLDFRIDDSVGPRMIFNDEKITHLVDKMRAGLARIKPVASNPSTGSVGILSNFKILHGRSALNPIMLYEGESSRVLFRSKGIRQ